MRINIDEFFDKPDYEKWLSKAMASLKLESEDDFERKLNFDTNEGVILKSNYTPKESLKLNSFHNQRKMARWGNQKEKSDLSEGVELFYSEEFSLDNKKWIDIFKHGIQDLVKDADTVCYIDTSIVHNAGGSIVQELIFLQSFLNEYVENNLSNNIMVNMACDSLFFCNIAKLRTTRYFLEFFQESFKTGEFQILSTPSKREMTIYDPWMNMLRGTANLSSAFIGGADILSVESYDYLSDEQSKLGIRQSRNVFHILEKESFLSQVNDPGRGSYVIETLSEEFLVKSFDEFKELQNKGGLNKNIKNWTKEVEKVSLKRKEYLAKNKVSIAGVNSYSNIDERFSFDKTQSNELFPLRRNSEEFESLRNKAQENNITTRVLVYGSEAKLSARIMFCTNYFEILGSKVEVEFWNEGHQETKEDNLVLCALDDEYEVFISKLNEKWAKHNFIAGNKFKHEKANNIFAGQNIFETLSQVVGA